MTEARLARMVRLARLPEPAERRRVREAAGLSRQQVADELGVTQAAVAYWESGTWTPTLENAGKYRALLEQLAEAAGTAIAEAS
jgi:predicted transcriptional regulator